MATIAPQSRRIQFLTVGLLAALAPCAWAAGPLRNTVQVSDPFDLRLTQKNVGRPIFVVTSDGNTFNDARLVRGAKSPMLIDFSVHCPDGFTDPFSGDVYSDGTLNGIRLTSGSWFADLPIVEESDNLFELFYDALDVTGVEGELNLFSQGTQASHVRSAFNALQPAVIEACNQALETKIGLGLSRATALSTIGEIDPLPQIAPEVLPAALWARCDYKVFRVEESGESEATYVEGFKTAETTPLQLRLPVPCEAPFAPPRPGADGFTQGFAVQEIELAPEQNPFRGECPLTVRLSGQAKLTGTGRFRYRYRTGSGGLGPVATVQVADGRTPVPLSLDFEVGGQPSGPGLSPTPPPGDPEPGETLSVTGPGGDPQGPTLQAPHAPSPPQPGGSGLATPTAFGEITDWVQLLVLEASQGARASRRVFYKALCERALGSAGGFRTPPEPDPGRLTARPPAPSPTVPPAPAPAGAKKPLAKPSAPPPARPPTSAAIAKPARAQPDLVLASVAPGRDGTCRLVVANAGKQGSARPTRPTTRRRSAAVACYPAGSRRVARRERQGDR